MQEINEAQATMIPVDLIVENPDNPRRSVGNVDELAESIKANGILQNLTVVPDGEKYMLVIGHRRCAAARQAGVTHLPCRVVNWDKREQLRVMMMENVQRNDLSNIEQADGFQLMLDMGDTVEDIERGTGFSKSTIRRRLSLLDYQRDLVEQAEQRGATLEDYAKINALPKEQQARALKVVQTEEFNSTIKKIQNEEKSKREIAEIRRLLETFAEEVSEKPENAKYISYIYCAAVNFEVQDGVRYYYKQEYNGFSVWRDYTAEELARQGENEKRIEQERMEQEKEKAEKEEIKKRFCALTTDFIDRQTEDGCKKAFSSIAYYAFKYGLERNIKGANDALGIETKNKITYGNVDNVDYEEAAEAEKKLRALPHLYIFRLTAQSIMGKSMFSYDKKRRLSNSWVDLYRLLEDMGYQCSAEERRWRGGR